MFARSPDHPILDHPTPMATMRASTGSTDRRIDKLIHLLVKNATVVVPGPKIASEIGVTRFKVWSGLKACARWGWRFGECRGKDINW